MFCPSCGRELPNDAAFCAGCGQRVLAPQQASPTAGQQFGVPPPQPIPQAAPTNPAAGYASRYPPGAEQVLGVVYPAKKGKSLGRWDTYTLVLTSYNMIFAQVTNELMKRSTEEVVAQSKAEGKGFFGRWADQMKQGLAFGQRYFGMQPAQILAETPGNFEISNDTISELKLKTSSRRTNQPNASYDELSLEVHSSVSRIDIVVPAGGNTVDTLKCVYGERVKTPFGYSSHLNFRIGV